MLLFFCEIYYLLMKNYTLYVENDANIRNKRDEIVNILYHSVWTGSHLKKYQNRSCARIFPVFISQRSDPINRCLVIRLG